MWFIRILWALPRYLIWNVSFLLEMVIYLADKLAWKILRMDHRTRYIREKACEQTGVCCEAIGLEVPRTWIRYHWMVYLFNAYQKHIHNFHCEGIQGEQMLVYTCGYFKNRRCTIHPFRPKLCREYPQLTLNGHAKVHKGCGFKFKLRNLEKKQGHL